MNNEISRKSAKLLKRSGWTPDRKVPEIVEAFVRGRAKDLSPAAKKFILSFGGIDVGAQLWIWSCPHQSHPSTSLEDRISKVVGASVVPVASANYFSADCVIWLDEFYRFYGVDYEGMIFLAEGFHDFFDVVLFDTQRADPPPSLQDSLNKAYKW